MGASNEATCRRAIVKVDAGRLNARLVGQLLQSKKIRPDVSCMHVEIGLEDEREERCKSDLRGACHSRSNNGSVIRDMLQSLV